MRRFLVVLLTFAAILAAGWFALQRAEDLGYDSAPLEMTVQAQQG